MLIELKTSGSVPVELAHAPRKSALAAPRITHERNALSRFHIQADTLEQLDVAVNRKGEPARIDSPMKIKWSAAVRFDPVSGFGVEVLHDSRIPDVRILIELVKIHQFLPWIIQFFVSRQEGHKGAEVEPAVYGKIAPDQKENKRSEVL